MSVQELESAVAKLTLEELATFSRWFEEYLGAKDFPCEDISADWKEEIQRRTIEIDEGQITLIEGEDFLKRLRAI